VATFNRWQISAVVMSKGIGLPVQLMSEVPNWGFSGPYCIDFIGTHLRSSPSMLVVEKSREINSPISKTALLTVIARPSRVATRRGHAAE